MVKRYEKIGFVQGKTNVAPHPRGGGGEGGVFIGVDTFSHIDCTYCYWSIYANSAFKMN